MIEQILIGMVIGGAVGFIAYRAWVWRKLTRFNNKLRSTRK